MNIGDKVIDDITGEPHTITKKLGNLGWEIDSTRFDGWRYEWELTVIK